MPASTSDIMLFLFFYILKVEIKSIWKYSYDGKNTRLPKFLVSSLGYSK